MIKKIQLFKEESMKSYYVYILMCSDDTYYVGVTNNLERRLNEHTTLANENSYTAIRQPVVLKYYLSFSSIMEAIGFEKKIKKWSRAKKEALINGEYNLLPALSKKKF